jgi:hypothetical protein
VKPPEDPRQALFKEKLSTLLKDPNRTPSPLSRARFPSVYTNSTDVSTRTTQLPQAGSSQTTADPLASFFPDVQPLQRTVQPTQSSISAPPPNEPTTAPADPTSKSRESSAPTQQEILAKRDIKR